METNKNPKSLTIGHSEMDTINNIIDIAVEASGYSKEEILSNNRTRPLPAIRWFIGDKLVQMGYSTSKAAKILNINHATLLHGRKQIPSISERMGWKEELDILTQFNALCK